MHPIAHECRGVLSRDSNAEAAGNDPFTQIKFHGTHYPRFQNTNRFFSPPPAQLGSDVGSKDLIGNEVVIT
jgi:hypothetical protein